MLLNGVFLPRSTICRQGEALDQLNLNLGLDSQLHTGHPGAALTTTPAFLIAEYASFICDGIPPMLSTHARKSSRIVARSRFGFQPRPPSLLTLDTLWRLSPRRYSPEKSSSMSDV